MRTSTQVRRCAAFLLATSILLAGCDSTSGGEPAINVPTVLQADQSRYDAMIVQDGMGRSLVEFTFVAIYDNATDDTLYLPACQVPQAPVLQKRVGGSWTYAWGRAEDLCKTPSWRVPPGETLRDTIHVRGYLPDEPVGNRFATEIPGTYRLYHYSVYSDAAEETLLYEVGRTSDSFEITLADEAP